MIADKIEQCAQDLLRCVEACREQEQALEGDIAAERLRAEREVKDLKLKVASLEQYLEEEQDRCSRLAKRAGEIRVALNGAGCGPVEEHARAVFRALESADPQHPLVQRKGGGR